MSSHLKTDIKFIIVEDVSKAAEKAPKSFNVTLFSPRAESQLKLCIEETSDCRDVNVKLSGPVDYITEVEHIIKVKGKNDGSSNSRKPGISI